MTFAYFDTSAFIKRYVSEKGSARVVSLLRRHDLLSSAITPVEVMSALCIRKRSGELSEEDFGGTMKRVKGERIRWELFELGRAVLSRAEDRSGNRAHEIDGRYPCGFLVTFQAASEHGFPSHWR
jgi:predicted nucleic acid-binding protein